MGALQLYSHSKSKRSYQNVLPVQIYHSHTWSTVMVELQLANLLF